MLSVALLGRWLNGRVHLQEGLAAGQCAHFSAHLCVTTERVLYRFGLFTNQTATVTITAKHATQASVPTHLSVSSDDGVLINGHSPQWLAVGCHHLEVTLRRPVTAAKESDDATPGDTNSAGSESSEEIALEYQQVYPFVKSLIPGQEALAIIPRARPVSADSLALPDNSPAKLRSTVDCISVEAVCVPEMIAVSIAYDNEVCA